MLYEVVKKQNTQTHHIESPDNLQDPTTRVGYARYLFVSYCKTIGVSTNERHNEKNRPANKCRRRAHTGFRATRDAASFFIAQRDRTVFKCKCCSRTRQRRYFSSTKRVSYVGGSINETFGFCYFFGSEFSNFSSVRGAADFVRFAGSRGNVFKLSKIL